MAIYPESIARADLQTYLTARSEYAGPKPPANPLARLIVSSIVDRSTEPPDSVRLAQANASIRRLTRLRVLVQAIGNGPALRAIDAQTAKLRLVR